MQLDVGVVASRLDHYGGAEIYLLECLKRWQREMKVTLYASSFRRSLLRAYGVDEDRVNLVRLPAHRATRGRLRLIDELVVQPRLWENAIGRHDLYFLYSFPMQFIRKSPSIWFASEPLRMLYDLRQQSHAHVYPRMRYEDVESSVFELLETLDAGSPIERLVANSRHTSGYLETVYGRPADLIARPGVDLPEEVGPPEHPTRAIFAGRLWQHKRVDLAIRAMAHLDRGELQVVGEGPERADLERLVRELGVADRVRFLGTVSKRRLAQLYGEAACGVYTPIREPFGMMPLEVGAAGRPSVLTPDGGYAEVLDRRCARFVDADPRQIAEGLRELFDRPDYAAELGRAARLKCSLHTWDSTARDLAAFMHDAAERSLLARRRRRTAPLLGAHYYPWYAAGNERRHWNDNPEYGAVTDPPASGIYSSRDPALLESHLKMAAAAALDFLVVNIQIDHRGLPAEDMAAATSLYDAVERSDSTLALAIQVSIATSHTDRIADSLEEIREKFLSRPAALRLRDRPVLWYFLSGEFLGYLYLHHRELQRCSRDLLPMATGNLVFDPFLPKRLREFFTGWCLYSPLQVGPPSSWHEHWRRGYDAFHHAKRGDGVETFSISPGYDDLALTAPERAGTSHRRIERDGATTYRTMQEAALALHPTPELVLVTSFNEFHENTHIEPSVAHGNLFLNETRRFKERLMEIAPKGAPGGLAARTERRVMGGNARRESE